MIGVNTLVKPRVSSRDLHGWEAGGGSWGGWGKSRQWGRRGRGRGRWGGPRCPGAPPPPISGQAGGQGLTRGPRAGGGGRRLAGRLRADARAAPATGSSEPDQGRSPGVPAAFRGLRAPARGTGPAEAVEPAPWAADQRWRGLAAWAGRSQIRLAEPRSRLVPRLHEFG